MGMSSGTKIRKMDIPSRNMPRMISSTISSVSTPYSPSPELTMACVMGSITLSVDRAQAKMPASVTTSMMTAESSAASRKIVNRSRAFMVRRSEEHTSELQSLMRISYAVFCLKKKKKNKYITLSTHKQVQ